MEYALVGLDREGTIIKNVDYLGRNDDWREQLEFLPGVIGAIRRLNDNQKIKITVCANEPRIALGFFGSQRAEEINSEINERLLEKDARIDNWQYCPYVDIPYAQKHGISNTNKWIMNEADGRKPKIGMLWEAANELGLNWQELYHKKGVYFVGDELSDVQTGLNANGKGIFVGGQDELEKVKVFHEKTDFTQRLCFAKNLTDAVALILRDITS